MDKDQAIRDVQEIKQVMEESRKRSNRRSIWIGPVVAFLAMAVAGLVPILSPFIAIGLIVGGIIAWRRSSDSITKAIASGIVAVGIVIIIAIIFVVVGLMAFNFSTGVRETVVPVPANMEIINPNP